MIHPSGGHLVDSLSILLSPVLRTWITVYHYIVAGSPCFTHHSRDCWISGGYVPVRSLLPRTQSCQHICTQRNARYVASMPAREEELCVCVIEAVLLLSAVIRWEDKLHPDQAFEMSLYLFCPSVVSSMSFCCGTMDEALNSMVVFPWIVEWMWSLFLRG